jgi:hypothetical protein
MTPHLHINPWDWAPKPKRVVLNIDGFDIDERRELYEPKRWWIARPVNTSPPRVDLVKPTLPNRK